MKGVMPIAATALGLVAVGAACGADESRSPPGPFGPRAVVAAPGTRNPDGSINVRHERELRGAWISTVYNGTWPSKPGLSPADAKSELIAIFDALATARMNVVFFQIRAESDAFYASAIEPWSRFLTGTQGRDPGWDPLAFAVEEGHRRGLEVHAWLNPYRALVDAKIAAASSHVTKTLAGAIRSYGTQRWMDPGAAEVKAHVLRVVRDIVSRYDVDGVHFDDYFYPYPVAGQTFDDADSFATYTEGGGALAKDDWRRSNVDALVRETAGVALATRADVRFGVSPFGIYRPGMPAGITGLDAYATLYCDPVRWMNEGWVDYLAPQLYWPTTESGQEFGKLVTWWAATAKQSRSIFVGHDATKAGERAFSIDEYEAQMTLAYAEREHGVRGSIFFSAKPLVADQAKLRTTLATKHWMLPAATPPLAIAAALPPAPPPKVVHEGNELVITAPEGRSVVIYAWRAPETDAGGSLLTIDRLVPLVGSVARIKLDRKEGAQWVLSVIDRRGLESYGAVVTAE